MVVSRTKTNNIYEHLHGFSVFFSAFFPFYIVQHNLLVTNKRMAKRVDRQTQG